MKYVRTLNESDPNAIEKDWLKRLYDGKLPTNSIIKADLEYISTTWNRTGFDLWEEADDMHFYTLIVQRRALVEGRNLAILLDDRHAAKWYESQQEMVKEFLVDNFWNQKRGHLMSMLNTPDRGGIDCSLVLGALHGGSDGLYPPGPHRSRPACDVAAASTALNLGRTESHHEFTIFRHLGSGVDIATSGGTVQIGNRWGQPS